MKKFYRYCFCWSFLQQVRNYFIVHLLGFIVGGFIGGTVIYLIELSNSSPISYMQGLFTGFSSLCVTGLMVVDISQFRAMSHVVVLLLILGGGVTTSTLPAILIKIFNSRQRMYYSRKWCQKHNLPLRKDLIKRGFFFRVKQLFGWSPFLTTDIEYLALIWLFIIIVVTIPIIILTLFLILGIYLSAVYNASELDGRNQWWVALFITISSFNNAGITLFEDSLSRFVSDWFFLLMVSFLIILGNTLFPFFLRSLLYTLKWITYRRNNSPQFTYILEHHHRLSIHLFPQLETSIYFCVTIVLQMLGIFICLGSEFNRSTEMLKHPGNVRFLISVFHSVSTRAAGFNTVDIATFGVSTLMVYVLMMRIKPQMFCTLNEEAYGVKTLIDNIRRFEEDPLNSKSVQTNFSNKHHQTQTEFPDDVLREVPITVPETPAKEETKPVETVSTVLDISTEFPFEFDVVMDEEIKLDSVVHKVVWSVKNFMHRLRHHGLSLFFTNNVWLVLIIFLICLTDQERFQSDPNHYSFFKVLFEIVSAYGNSGLSLGFPGTNASFTYALSGFSQFLVMTTMVIGRHRGMKGAMRDQSTPPINQLIMDLRPDRECHLTDRPSEERIVELDQEQNLDVHID